MERGGCSLNAWVECSHSKLPEQMDDQSVDLVFLSLAYFTWHNDFSVQAQSFSYKWHHLNENGLCRLVCLNPWSLIGRAVLEGLAGMVLLLGALSLRLLLGLQRPSACIVNSLPSVCGPNFSCCSSALPACLPYQHHAHCHGGDRHLSLWNSKPPNKIFLL